MATSHGMKQVGYVDCAGGGQVIVRNGIAYVGHMRAPHGTTIIDVRDPKRPVVLAELSMPPGTHSHKLRIAGDVMVINQEFNFNDERRWSERSWIFTQTIRLTVHNCRPLSSPLPIWNSAVATAIRK